MTKDQTNINDILYMPIGDVANYDSRKLYELQQQAMNAYQHFKSLKQWIEAAISLKYQQPIKAKRTKLGKNTGTIHIEDNGYKISNDIPKKVQWQQERLTAIAKDLTQSGDNPEDYLNISYKVPESGFNSWPEDIRKIFIPARIIKAGKPTYLISKLDENVKDITFRDDVSTIYRRIFKSSSHIPNDSINTNSSFYTGNYHD